MIILNHPEQLINRLNEILVHNESLIKKYCSFNNSFYSKFYIPKRSGGLRKIEAPNEVLCGLLRKILVSFSESGIIFPDYVTGFVRHRNIVNNASIHLKSNVLLNIDLKNFFNSIKKDRIIKTLCFAPFNFSNQLSTTIANVVTKDSYLPQGSPLSPLLSNIIASEIDSELSEFCINNNLRYSRYVDDMTFSKSIGRIEEAEISNIKDMIKSKGFLINEKKVKVIRKSKRLVVTGITVNSRLNIRRSYLMKLRARLHKYANSKKQLSNARLESLRGKIEFVGLVRGKNDHIYQRYLTKFYHLEDKDEKTIRQLVYNSDEFIDDEFINLIS